jgi:hypothetical protein
VLSLLFVLYGREAFVDYGTTSIQTCQWRMQSDSLISSVLFLRCPLRILCYMWIIPTVVGIFFLPMSILRAMNIPSYHDLIRRTSPAAPVTCKFCVTVRFSTVWRIMRETLTKGRETKGKRLSAEALAEQLLSHGLTLSVHCSDLIGFPPKYNTAAGF